MRGSPRENPDSAFSKRDTERVISKLRSLGVFVTSNNSEAIANSLRVYRNRLLAERLGLNPGATPDEINVALIGETTESAEAGKRILGQVNEELERDFHGSATVTTILSSKK